MHSLNPFTCSSSGDDPYNKASTSSSLNLLLNHKQEQLRKEMQSTEENITNYYQKIFESTTEEKQLKNLEYLKKACDQLIDTTKKRARLINKIDYQKILNYIKKLPVYNGSNIMNDDEENKFKLIEKTLANPCLISANETQVIEYQLGVLWNVYKNEKLSDRLFYYLTIIRTQQVSPHFAFCQHNNILYESSCAEICESIDKNLSKDETYTSAIELFNQRLDGIELEIMQEKSTNHETTLSMQSLIYGSKFLEEDKLYKSIFFRNIFQISQLRFLLL